MGHYHSQNKRKKPEMNKTKTLIRNLSIFRKKVEKSNLNIYPANSPHKEVGVLQKQIFGGIDSYDNLPSGRKFAVDNGYGERIGEWYGFTEPAKRRGFKKYLKKKIEESEKEGNISETEFLNSFYLSVAKSPKQIKAEQRRERDLKRGKQLRKKGEGRRQQIKK
eukprot:maker-scaffold_44-snap-gene-1.98-mRNA-1 protein AED:0.35 eAED:0.35 QI:84/1/1/1/1/1/2/82/163